MEKQAAFAFKIKITKARLPRRLTTISKCPDLYTDYITNHFDPINIADAGVAFKTQTSIPCVCASPGT